VSSADLQEELVMSILRNVGAVVVGLLPLVVGCAQPGSDESEEDLGVAQQAEGGGTFPTNNGHDPNVAQGCEPAVLTAMGMRLIDPTNQSQMNPQLPASVLPGGACVEALEYAYGCAGAVATSLPGYTNPPIHGRGLVDTATGWRDAALTQSQKVDVFTCVSTLLNLGGEVPICLSGVNVSAADNSGCASFGVVEAVWLALPTATGNVEHHVWPLLSGQDCDEEGVKAALGDRICGQAGWEQCGLTFEDDFANDCTLQNGHYECFGQPAILSKLSVSGAQSLHPRCEL
jgi:hypothetical protein